METGRHHIRGRGLNGEGVMRDDERNERMNGEVDGVVNEDEGE